MFHTVAAFPSKWINIPGSARMKKIYRTTLTTIKNCCATESCVLCIL